MENKIEWEYLAGPDFSMTFRLKVPDGWIVKDLHTNELNSTLSEAMVFLPDKDHSWLKEKE